MSKLRFEAKDFDKIDLRKDGECIALHASAQYAICEAFQAKFDAWLAEQPVVYGRETPSTIGVVSWGIYKEHADNHQARLVDIQPLVKEKCEHKDVHFKTPLHGNKMDNAYCHTCGIKLRATWSEAE